MADKIKWMSDAAQEVTPHRAQLKKDGWGEPWMIGAITPEKLSELTDYQRAELACFILGTLKPESADEVVEAHKEGREIDEGLWSEEVS